LPYFILAKSTSRVRPATFIHEISVRVAIDGSAAGGDYPR
jgi:hypothetical protein